MKNISENLHHYRICSVYCFLMVYLLILFYYAVISRSSDGNFHIQTDIFWSYINPDDDIWKDNYLNVMIFVPLGFSICLLSKRFVFVKAFLGGLLISETIECCQLIFKRGTFDVDDIINNAAGAIIGAIIWFIVIKLKFRIVGVKASADAKIE